MQLLKRDQDRERADTEKIWKRAMAGLEATRITDEHETESSVTMVPESEKTQTSSTMTPIGAQRCSQSPGYVKFVDDFIENFRRSSAQRICLPRDRRFSRDQLLYFSETADNVGLDANMEIDDDGEQVLCIKKLS